MLAVFLPDACFAGEVCLVPAAGPLASSQPSDYWFDF